ncbi:hypothetical protein J4E89_004324 [Alternaria sp. Ai002NY15]|nr:hypothetical protein J4E89_004324 [Alternaria sp. Ai002NY15]
MATVRESNDIGTVKLGGIDGTKGTAINTTSITPAEGVVVTRLPVEDDRELRPSSDAKSIFHIYEKHKCHKSITPVFDPTLERRSGPTIKGQKATPKDKKERRDAGLLSLKPDDDAFFLHRPYLAFHVPPRVLYTGSSKHTAQPAVLIHEGCFWKEYKLQLLPLIPGILDPRGVVPWRHNGGDKNALKHDHHKLKGYKVRTWRLWGETGKDYVRSVKTIRKTGEGRDADVITMTDGKSEEPARADEMVYLRWKNALSRHTRCYHFQYAGIEFFWKGTGSVKEYRTCGVLLRFNHLKLVARLPVAEEKKERRDETATQRKDEDDGKQEQEDAGNNGNGSGAEAEKEEGAFTRRMREMSEDALESGGHGAVKAVEEAGFSADLKAQLEQRIASANLRSSEAELPAFASRHTRELATTEAWTGTESIHDASLRMLNDTHKPLRLGRPAKMPGVPIPQSIDTGHARSKEGRGVRLANARDRSTVYASINEDESIEAFDREKRLQDLKDRFEPGARTIVPGSIQGIASLANKRIEDAIARGQFKNIPRGKKANIERDYNASSPFIDTTEYFMNKIIQKQEIVPPWIEKQQELTSAASKFRTRLRADWKRHAARVIASKGGSLLDQIKTAEAFAKAELIANPLRRKQQETLTTVDDDGHMSQITLSGGLKVDSEGEGSNAEPVVTEEVVAKKVTFDASPEAVAQDPAAATVTETTTETMQVSVQAPEPTVAPAPYPFRDPDWERIESGYWKVAIKDLNDKARSYNLLAPELAKRPYYNLQRELNSCFADVAPQLAGAILERARKPPKKADSWQSSGQKSVLDNIIGGPVRVRDERREKQYGFRQFWKDLWADKSSNPY